jgi:DNA-binding XRE family transcriptional regulator
MSTAILRSREPKQFELLPDAFPGGIGRLPSNPVVSAYMEAIAKGGKRAQNIQNGWVPNSSGSPVYPHNRSSGNYERIVVYTDLPRRADKAPATIAEEWDVVEGFGPWTIDVVLSFLTQICERSSIGTSMYSAGNQGSEPTLMTADTILRNKRIQRRGTQRRQMYQSIDDAVARLQSLKYEARWSVSLPAIARGKPKFGIQRWTNDQLFDIVALETWQQGFWEDDIARLVSVKWSVRPGQWAKFWFNADQKPWIANCARTLLTLDHRQNSGPDLMAKKIGVYFTLLPAAAHGHTIELRVRTLLEHIGELPEASRHSPGRTRDRLESALAILVEKGFLQWKWPDEEDSNDDRNKGWLQRWLNRKLSVTLVTPSQAVPLTEARSPSLGRTGRQRRRANREIDVAQLRLARVERQLTQKEVASSLGISASYLSAIETGERRPSSKIMEKIRGFKWLSSPPAKFDFGDSPRPPNF